MRKAIALCITVLLASCLFTVQTATAQHTSDGKPFPLASGINILSPTNTTYDSTLVLLNVAIKSLLPPSMYQYEITYSINGENNATLATELTFIPVEATVTYPNGTTVNQTSVFGSYYLISGQVKLQSLPEGSHKITVYGKYKRTYDKNPNLPALIIDSKTVYFIINFGIPPVITNLSIQNATYNKNSLSLNFAADKPVSWTAYCLDHKENVTIVGSTTLTNFTNGPHSLTIYANDTVGNMGASETVHFNLKMPEDAPLQTAVVGASASVAVMVIGLVVVSRKQKHQYLFFFLSQTFS